jgi:small redox-active disulfide protein 2
MSLDIRIIGKGCYFCQQMTKIATEVVAELGAPEATVEQVDELDELLDFGVVNPPALVVNGKLKMMGRVLVRSHVQQAISEEMGESQK